MLKLVLYNTSLFLIEVKFLEFHNTPWEIIGEILEYLKTRGGSLWSRANETKNMDYHAN